VLSYLVKDPYSREYFSRFPFTAYLVTFACEVHELISKYNHRLTDEEEYGKLVSKNLLNYHVDLSDYLYYFNDLHTFGTDKAIEVIRNAFDAYITRPLLRMLLSENELVVKHGLLLMTECIKIIKDRHIVEHIILSLLAPKIKQQYFEVIGKEEKVYVPQVYQSKFQPDDFYWNKYRNEIVNHCLKIFVDVEKFTV
jgi:hypothetical protein